jgi:hypothetical protein
VASFRVLSWPVAGKEVRTVHTLNIVFMRQYLVARRVSFPLSVMSLDYVVYVLSDAGEMQICPGHCTRIIHCNS